MFLFLLNGCWEPAQALYWQPEPQVKEEILNLKTLKPKTLKPPNPKPKALKEPLN